jgi:hypothetical protein
MTSKPKSKRKDLQSKNLKELAEEESSEVDASQDLDQRDSLLLGRLSQLLSDKEAEQQRKLVEALVFWRSFCLPVRLWSRSEYHYRQWFFFEFYFKEISEKHLPSVT